MERKAVLLLTVFVLFGSIAGKAAEGLVKSDGGRSLDKSDVTWAHGVNSRAQLEKELEGPVDFLESDVSLGKLKSGSGPVPIPIMAHPSLLTSDLSSDLSLDTFIEIVTNRNTGKGVKLDFKSLDVVEPSLIILQRYSGKLNFTLFLNADILSGPVQPTNLPVKEDRFLLLCHQYFPEAVVSVGWTTDWWITYLFSKDNWFYKWNHVRKMADTIRCLGYENKYPEFTFPVRGIYASRSIPQLQWLLGVIPSSSLTVWTHKYDPLELEDLKHIRKSFPASKVYYDVPNSIGDKFQQWKNSTNLENSSTSKNQWMTFTRGTVSDCASFTYTTNDIIVFGQSMTTAVLLKKIFVVDEKHGFNARGMVRFFSGYDTPQKSSVGHRLTIVIVDVSLLAKNSSSEALDLSQSDTDVLWTAMNASIVHTFEENSPDKCRVFMLETGIETYFQAWRVPCNELVNHDSTLESMASKGVKEIPADKKLVLPKGSYMIGFMSSGDGHAVVHNFEVGDGKGKKPITGAASVVRQTIGSVLFGVLFVFLFNRLRSK